MQSRTVHGVWKNLLDSLAARRFECVHNFPYFMADKKTSLADIAKRLGISKSAVSLAMRGSAMVSPETRELVEKTAREMGYVKNALVSSMMSSIKRGREGSFSETIALVNGNYDESALSTHPTLPKYCAGIREEASRLGYSVNEFWLHSPDMTGKSFARILRSRGIRGGIILGHSFGTVFPKSYKAVWDNFYFIAAGIIPRDPKLEIVSADHYAITHLSVEKAVELGYKRPAIAVQGYIDDLVDGRLIGGFLRGQLKLPESNRIPPFMDSEKQPDYREKICAWVEKHRPDVVFYLLSVAREALMSSPRVHSGKVALIQLEHRRYVRGWRGVEQNNDVVGRIAMRRLADMLSRSSSVVGENANITTLISPTVFS